ncbi:MAG: single-stranded DNA-binding protein [Desulfovibrio sp.]|jgi:single-strand DNA-binding protein|nr:single-stranded DNA-binding protein [Desulfovibrio sp.]
MVNKVILIGRLGRDPELRYTSTGMPVANLNIATDESYTDREGNRVEKTEWHKVIVFQRDAENCANYLSKGRLVYVEGSLQTRKWQDQQGQDRYTTEVKAQRVRFLERKGSREEGEDGAPRKDDGAYRKETPRPREQERKDGNRQEDFGPAFPSEAGGMDDVPF